MSKALSLTSSVKLNSGHSIPILGLGVYRSRGEECIDAVTAALDAGYRHIDSAAGYGNESQCGRAVAEWLKKTGNKRQDIFFTTKLRDSDHGYKNTKSAIDQSLAKWGNDYIDLFLIHTPSPGKAKRLESWLAIEEAVQEGKVKSAGVSNYGVHHLQELLDTKPKVVPSVNQVELHPYLQRRDIDQFCRKHGIALEAYSPLTRGQSLANPELISIAQKYNKSTAQLLIRYSLQKGWIPLPKSANKERIEQNANVFDFEITREDFAALESLERYGTTGWDPTRAK